MASPQLEKGHTRIAHEIMEAIVRSNLSATQIRATLWILRLTYGFQRKEFKTNIGAFASKLRSSGKYVKEVLLELERISVITVIWESSEVCNITFNKDFDQWSCFL